MKDWQIHVCNPTVRPDNDPDTGYDDDIYSELLRLPFELPMADQTISSNIGPAEDDSNGTEIDPNDMFI